MGRVNDEKGWLVRIGKEKIQVVNLHPRFDWLLGDEEDDDDRMKLECDG